MAAEEPSTWATNLSVLESLSQDSIGEIVQSWDSFCLAEEVLLKGSGDISAGSSELISTVQILCKHGLQSLVQEHFLRSVEEVFEKNAAMRFWRHFEPYKDVAALETNNDPMQKDEIQEVLCKALEEVSSEKQHQEKCLWMLVTALQSELVINSEGQISVNAQKVPLFEKYQLIVSSVLMTSLPRHFPEVLRWYFKERLEELSTIMEEDNENDTEQKSEDIMDVDGIGKLACRSGDMDVDGGHLFKRFSENNKLVQNIGTVVRNLRSIGLSSIAEDAYASAIFSLLNFKVQDLAGDDFRNSVWYSIKDWIQAVPLRFLRALLAYLGDYTGYACPSSSQKSPLASQPSPCCFGCETPAEGLVRWKLRLEYFAYESLQDLRIAKLFDIIVDYPDSGPAIEDLQMCLEHTGQHSKLVDSFISSLRYRLLTAGASTNDILHQYVSTIKALRTIDPAGVFLEAVGEPIREYLRGRKDTIKCIVTMLTDGTGGSNCVSGSTGDSLLEELNRDEENQENTNVDDYFNPNYVQVWNNAERWEPDPVEADSFNGSRSRKKIDILSMIVGIIGSKDQLINEYRVMLAEKLLNKYDYDIDSEIRNLELLKIHFGESCMQRCEIMLNDLIDSKRTNTNIKATIKQKAQPELEEHELSMDILSSTILSSNFWPPIQDETLNLPAPVDRLLSDYAKRFNQIKTPRKLLWKKNLGTVKLELQFEDKEIQVTVTPLQASIIMQFQNEKSWSSKDLAAAVGVPVDVLSRRISFWISKGVLSESAGEDAYSHVFSLVEGVNDNGKTGSNNGSCEELMVGDDDGGGTVASVEDQLRKEMTVYEKFIMGMLTNFGSMALDRIHNTLKMFCVADPAYDKSLQQLQSFLSGLVAEEKLELRDGMYHLRK